MTMTRRDGMKGLLTLAAAAYVPAQARAAADTPIPPQGLGRRIRHLSYSDQGGRPDGVQVGNRFVPTGDAKSMTLNFSPGASDDAPNMNSLPRGARLR